MFPHAGLAHPTLSEAMAWGPVSRLLTNWGVTWEPDVTLLTFQFLLTLSPYPCPNNKAQIAPLVGAPTPLLLN